MSVANKELRTWLKDNGIPIWKIADGLSVSEMTVTRMFRHELPDERKEEIKEIARKCRESAD